MLNEESCEPKFLIPLSGLLYMPNKKREKKNVTNLFYKQQKISYS